MQVLIILVGLKGSGKTYIGSLLRDRLGINFIRVEDLWLSIAQKRLTEEYFEEGFRLVEEEIDEQFTHSNIIVIESTGLSHNFRAFLENMCHKYQVKLINVKAAPDTCRHRVKTRDTSVHISVSDDLLEQINRQASKVHLDFDAIIDNERSSDHEIIQSIRQVLP